MKSEDKHLKELLVFRKRNKGKQVTPKIRREGWILLRKMVAEDCQMSEAQVEYVYRTFADKVNMWAESGRVELPGFSMKPKINTKPDE
ncbi:MAG: hypothetical protein ACRC6R_10210 [Bacteroidales bacterium]